MTYSQGEGRYFLIFLLAILFIGGCDRIPFLSKIPRLSSAPKTEPAPPTPPSLVINGTLLVRVGNWVLTLEDFNKKIEAVRQFSPEFKIETLDQKKNLLDELVRQQLLVKEAQSRGLDKKEEIKNAMEEFERGLLVRSLMSQLTEDIKVDSKEIEDYYRQYKDKDPFIQEPAQWRVREIVVATPAQANEVLIELLRGADFASLAAQYSKSTSAKNGGDLGFINQAKFPQLQSAIVSLEVGGISNVIKGPDGFYIVKLEEKKGGKEKSLSEVWDYIKSGLTSLRQGQKLQDYIAKLREQEATNIEIHEDLLR